MRYFEVELIDGRIAALSEVEIEQNRVRVQEVRTEFTDKEIQELGFKESDKLPF